MFSKFSTQKFCKAKEEGYLSEAAHLNVVPDSQSFSEWKMFFLLLMDLSGKYTTLYNLYIFYAKGSASGIHS